MSGVLPHQIGSASYGVKSAFHPELESYGVVPDTFVIDVCETWTGSDYDVQTTVRSSNSPELEAADAAPTVVYGNTYVEGYGSGGQFQDREYVGNSAFDYVNASSAEIQASYDDPYYGVRGSGGAGGGGGGCETGCQLAYPFAVGRGYPSFAPNPAPLPGPPSRHGVTRRGIRYLVNDLEEVESAPNGNRRFRGRRGDTALTLELEKETELLVGEEYASPTVRLRTRHVWARSGDLWFRNRSFYEGEVQGSDGVWRRYRGTVTVTNLTVSDRDVTVRRDR